MRERKKPSQSWMERSIEEIEKEAFNKGWEAGVAKACEWIRDKIPYYVDDMIDFIYINFEKMESDFRKAMLEEEKK